MLQRVTVRLSEVLGLSENNEGETGIQVPTSQDAHLPLRHAAANPQLRSLWVAGSDHCLLTSLFVASQK